MLQIMLAPLTVERFSDRYWGRRALVVRADEKRRAAARALEASSPRLAALAAAVKRELGFSGDVHVSAIAGALRSSETGSTHELWLQVAGTRRCRYATDRARLVRRRLREGDLLYLPPRSRFHVQPSEDSRALSLTFHERGAGSTADLVTRVLEAILEEHAAWRSAPPPCPPELDDGVENGAIAAHFRARLRELGEVLERRPAVAARIDRAFQSAVAAGRSAR